MGKPMGYTDIWAGSRCCTGMLAAVLRQLDQPACKHPTCQCPTTIPMVAASAAPAVAAAAWVATIATTAAATVAAVAGEQRLFSGKTSPAEQKLWLCGRPRLGCMPDLRCNSCLLLELVFPPLFVPVDPAAVHGSPFLDHLQSILGTGTASRILCTMVQQICGVCVPFDAIVPVDV